MNFSRTVEILFTALAAALAFSAFVWWRAREIPMPEPAAPGRDGAGNRVVEAEKVKIGEFFRKSSELTEAERNAEFPDWPVFRGNVGNVAESAAPLDFNLENAKVKYRIKLGEGYAAPAIWKNKFYVLDYDEEAEADCLRAFALSDGRELWRRWYKVKIRRNHGKSRTVVGVSDGVVVSLGPMGQVMACDAESGDFLWGRDLVMEDGAEIPQWYSGQCPLLSGGEAVIAPAGPDALLAGFDLRTGKANWSAPNSKGFKMSHSSVSEMTLLGRRQFVYCAVGGVAGVSAEGPDKGKVLWISDEWKPNVFAPSPVKVGDGRIFLTAGYGAGGAVLELSESGGKWDAKIRKSWKAKEGIACEQQTPILFKNRLLSILPKDAGGMNSLMAAASADGDCPILFTSPRGKRFGIGPYIAVNEKILVLDDNGKLYVLNMSDNSFEVESERKFFDGGDSWGPMAFSNGLLLLRDSVEIACVDLRKDKDE